MNVTIYTKPLCPQCDATKRALDKRNIAYTTVDVTADSAALAHIKSLGFLQAPVVITDNAQWSGFRPDYIKTLAA